MAKISVIVPVYNVEEYLRESLDSIVNQTFQELEIICVNDGSTDSSLEILKEYAGKDSRIKIINQENQGQGAARNNAIEIATGEYLGFVDPDDWIEPDMYEKAYNAIKNTDLDFVEFYSVNRFINKPSTISKTSVIPINKIYNPLDYPEFIFKRFAAWNKLFKTDFIKRNNIKFGKGRLAEDQIFTIKARCLANGSYFIDEALYNYRKLINSSTRGFNLDQLNRVEMLKDLRIFFIEQGIFNQLEPYFETYFMGKLAYAYSRVPEEYKEDWEKSVREFLSNDQLKEYNKRKLLRKKSFFENIFSVINRNCPEGKVKVITILGLEFKLKKVI